MWTSERSRRPLNQEAEAETGLVTMGGDPAGVLLGGERRWLPVYSPGGYAWRPTAGDKVLVLKTGGERESPCILGKAQDTDDLGQGEVRLTGGDSRLQLGPEGAELSGGGSTAKLGSELELSCGESGVRLGEVLNLIGEKSSIRLGKELGLSGSITVNGQSLYSYIESIVYSVLSDLLGG